MISSKFGSHKNPQNIRGNADDNNLKSDKDISNRIHQIEKTLGFIISSSRSEIQGCEITSHAKVTDQALQLVSAFSLIADADVRADILSMVIAAAQRESGRD